jgi:UDP-3-O-[3-hydroxymyristoyl] glucosamine N-acyltransferase
VHFTRTSSKSETALSPIAGQFQEREKAKLRELRSVVHPSFKHGRNFKIGNFSVVEEDVHVGNGVCVGHSCVLKRGTRCGDDVKIGDNVVIGALEMEEARRMENDKPLAEPRRTKR